MYPFSKACLKEIVATSRRVLLNRQQRTEADLI